MAGNLPNNGSKYYIISKEDSHGKEKWEEFISRNADGTVIVDNQHPYGISPPDSRDANGAAVQFKDFISVDYTEGDYGDRGGTDDEFNEGNVRKSVKQETVVYQEPTPTLELGFKDLLFVLSTVLRQEKCYVDLPNPTILDKRVLMVEDGTRTITPTTHYIGKYDDEEYRVRGAQLGEIDLDFGNDGIITADTSWVSSKDKLGFLKNQATFEAMIQEPFEGWWLNSLWIKYYEPRCTYEPEKWWDINEIGNPQSMNQIGCSMSGVKLSINFNLDTDQGRNFCQKFSSIDSVGNLNEFLGELSKNRVEISLECTNNQTVSTWLQEYWGALGQVELMERTYFRIGLLFMNASGELMRLALPAAELGVNTPDLSSDGPEETITFTAGTGTFQIRMDLEDEDMNGVPLNLEYGYISIITHEFNSGNNFNFTGTFKGNSTTMSLTDGTFVFNGVTFMNNGVPVDSVETDDYTWRHDARDLVLKTPFVLTSKSTVPPRGVAIMLLSEFYRGSSQIAIRYETDANKAGYGAGLGEAMFDVHSEAIWDMYFAETTAYIINKSSKQSAFLLDLPKDYEGTNNGFVKILLWPGQYELWKFKKDTQGNIAKIYCGEFVMDSSLYHVDSLLDLTACYSTNTSRADGTICPGTINISVDEPVPGVDRPYLTGEDDLMNSGNEAEDEDESPSVEDD